MEINERSKINFIKNIWLTQLIYILYNYERAKKI